MKETNLDVLPEMLSENPTVQKFFDEKADEIRRQTTFVAQLFVYAYLDEFVDFSERFLNKWQNIQPPHAGQEKINLAALARSCRQKSLAPMKQSLTQGV